ncbi:hypothetical protein FALBO_17425, partial [Fusarium albosuccineum]
KRKKKGKSHEVTVHEFEKTTKFPSFLKDSVPEGAPKTATEFVEGKGWVDENGDVVETVKTKKKHEPAPKRSKKKTPPPVEESDDDSTSSSGTSSSGSSSDEDAEEEAKEKVEKATKKEVPQKDDSSSSEDSSDDDDSPQQPEHSTPISAIKADTSRPMSSSSSRSLTIKIP